jgi:LytR_cpsA_psr family
VFLVVVATVGYLVYRHLNDNIAQANVRAYIGKQPADPHPKAESILLIGSDTPPGGAGAAGQGPLMLVHIAADKRWAEVMVVPPYSWVSIPSCKTGNGQLSRPRQSEIDQAYVTGNQDGNYAALGAACTIKTIEQNTRIYINDFIVVDFSRVKDIVAASGGAARIKLEEAFMASLITRAKGKLYDPLATYQFLNSVTRSLTVDSQLGGMAGLYHLERSLHGIPDGKVTVFALPSYRRAYVVPSDTEGVLWTQPADSQIFASFRDDVRASRSLLATPGRPARFGVSPSATPGL